MFTQPCFIRKNTPELRKILKDIGQRENTLDDFSGEWLAANYGMFISVSEGFQNLHQNDIDCGTNEKLFLALAALRDDTDKNQWFVDYSTGIDGGSWYLCELDHIDDCFQSTKKCHKATVEEIIEHFKEK